MAVDRLDIQVNESGQGSRSVAEGFRVMAGHIRDSGSEFQKIKKHLKGNVVGAAAKQYKSLNAQMRALHHTTKIAESGVSKASAAYDKLNKQNRALHKTTNLVANGLDKVANSANDTRHKIDETTTAAKNLDSNLKRLSTDLGLAGRTARNAGSGIGTFASQSKTARRSSAGLVTNVRGLRTAFATLGGVIVARGFFEMSDAYQNMGNRIRLVTTDTAHFEKTQKRLQDTAFNTRQNLGATVETYVRLRKATKDLGVSDERLFGTLTTINKMLAISGQTAQESEQSIRQLSQAFSKGKLDGDEFRTVAEAMPDILEALQSSLGVTKRELYAMSEAGQLTSEVLLNAFDHISDKVDTDYKNSIETLGQSWEKLKTRIVIAIGEFNQATGAMTKLSIALGFLSNNTWILVLAAKALAFWLGTMLVKAIIGGAVAAFGFLAQALMVAQVAFYAARTAVFAFLAATGPIGAIALGIGIAIGAMKVFSGVIDSVTDKLSGMDKAKENAGTSRQDSSEKWLAQYRRQLVVVEQNLKHARKNSNQEFAAQSLKRSLAHKEELEMKIHLAESEIAGLVATKRNAQSKIEARKASEKLSESYLKLRSSMDPTIDGAKKLKTGIQVLFDTFKSGNVTIEETVGILDGLLAKFSSIVTPVKAYTEELKQEILVLEMSKNARTVYNAELTATKRIQRTKGQGFADSFEGLKAIKKLTALELEKQRLIKKNSRSGKRKSRPKETELQKLQKQLLALRRGADPAFAAMQDLNKATLVLDKSLKRNLITFDQYLDLLAEMKKKGHAVISPLDVMENAFLGTAEKAKWSTERMADFNRTAELTEKLLSTRVNKALTDNEAVTIARIVAGEKEVSLERDKVKAMESAINALEEQNTLVAKSNVLHEAADKAQGLSLAQRRLAHLEAELSLYPQISSEVLALASGQRSLTSSGQEGLDAQLAITDALNLYLVAVQTGAITQMQYGEALRGLQEDMSNAAKTAAMTEGVFGGLLSLFTSSAIEGMERNLFVSMFTNAEDAMVSFITTGEYTMEQFKGVVNSMLSDLSRLVARMLIAKAIEASFGLGGGGSAIGSVVNSFRGGPNAAFRHGGSFPVDRSMPGPFAHGGSFHVGGAGGPDTKLVQFMASPGERVTVTNPGQSSLDGYNANKPPKEDTPIVVNNIVDADMALSALASPAGRRVITNVIQNNAPQFRKFLAKG